MRTMRRSFGITACWLTGMLVTGCADTRPASIAASNEVFGPTSVAGGGVDRIDDRWAAVALDARQGDEVHAIFREMVEGPVEPLRPAPHGIRFEDVPRAILNAAPTVEMAVMSGGLLPEEVRVDYRDALGRRAAVVVELRPLGAMVSVSYDVAGGDAADDRAGLTIEIQRILDDLEVDPDSPRTIRIVRREIESIGGVVEDVDVVPERYRYTVLMLDEQEVDIVIRREPPPRIVSWSTTAGLFGDDARGEALGRALESALRAWGRVPESD